MGGLLPEFFSNEKANDEGKTDVTSPAFSLTKVQAGLGALIVAIGAVAAKIEGTTAVKVASIGGAALVMLGVFALGAVDIIARQRAQEAKLRWGPGSTSGGDGDGPITLLPDDEGLVLQSGPQGEEFGIQYVELDGEKVTVVARRKGQTLAPTFHPRS